LLSDVSRVEQELTLIASICAGLGWPLGPSGLPPMAACIFCIDDILEVSSFTTDTHHPFCPPACLAMPDIIRAWASSSSTSRTLVPLPLATRRARLLRPTGLPALSNDT
jgi:hypothetical protein